MADNKAYQMDDFTQKKESSGKSYDPESSSVRKESKTKVYMKRSAYFALWIVALEGIGLGIGIGFPTGDWYDTINKPSVTPPDVVFGIVWPILYGMLAIFGCWLTFGLKHTVIKVVFSVYCIQMVTNWVWIPTFQYFHELIAGAVIIAVLVLMNLYIFIRLLTLNIKILSVSVRWISLLILPYIIWCSFATYLGIYIAIYND